MNILYLGSFPTSELIAKSHGAIDSLYRDDNAIIAGLRSLDNVDISVITIPDIASFPNQKLFIGGFYDKTDNVLSLPLFNLPIIKQLWIIITLMVTAARIVRKNKGITYIVTPYIVLHHVFPSFILKLLSKKRVKNILVVPDIFFPKSVIHRWLNSITEKLAKNSDGFILYTKPMAGYLGIKDKPHVVIEGFKEIKPLETYITDTCFHIVYTGSLNMRYGIGRLVDSLSYINKKDIILDLYGDGDGVSYIKKVAKSDIRIKYWGKVSKTDATKALYEASVLVNPRSSSDGEYVMYSFPSKDIDYMGTGIPTILCILPGMPPEYYGNFIDAGDGTAEELASAIMKVYNMGKEQRSIIGKKAQDFVVKRMDCHQQGLKIYNMIQGI